MIGILNLTIDFVRNLSNKDFIHGCKYAFYLHRCNSLSLSFETCVWKK